MVKNVYTRVSATALTAVVAASILGFSCTAAAKTPVNFWHSMGGQLGEVVVSLVNQFNASQDDFEVKAVYKGSYAESMTAAIAAYKAKNNPAIVQVFEVGTQTMLMSGAIYPVYKLMKDNKYKIDWDSFVPPVLGYYQKDGNLYSMPFNSSTPIFYYNKDIFAKAGLDSAKAPATWQEVEQAGKKLVAAKLSDSGFSIGWPSWTMVENMHAWHGLQVATRDNGFTGLNTELTINDKFGIMHVGKLAEWQKEGIFKYAGRSGAADPLFVNSNVGMYIQSSALIGGFSKSITKFDWNTGMLPHWGGSYKKANSIIGGATLWVLKGCQTAEYKGTAAFLNFLSKPQQQAFWHKNTGYVCISTEAQEMLEKEGYLTKNPKQRTAYMQLTYSKPKPWTKGLRLGNFSQIRDVIEEELENIFAGKKSSQTGLDDATRRGNQLLRDFERLYR